MASRACVVYSSEWGTTKSVAESLVERLTQGSDVLIKKEQGDKITYSWESEKILTLCPFGRLDAWLEPLKKHSGECNLLFLIGTGQDGAFPSSDVSAFESLEELEGVVKKQGIDYSVIGYGDIAYGSLNFCAPAVRLNSTLKVLGLRRREKLVKVSKEDTEMPRPMSNFEQIIKKVLGTIEALDGGELGSEADSDFSIEDAALQPMDENAEMLSDSQRKALKKQGYKIVGTHSAVKLCRWTQHQLRGRGGCYKHTFYGIQSHQCMESTCCLACANKCVFCWRHHKNPVTTEWRWKQDSPEEIVSGAIAEQKKMIKVYKGAQGTDKDRVEEAYDVRHCALSLVGEPILFPQINGLLDSLHKRSISTFLVTNAQFPEQIGQLTPCTQLYVSVDASNAATMKVLDRPLFPDFWERFLKSLTLIKDRPERTVYRLTLLKNQNMQDLLGYADLIPLGMPDFIELKGVTFSGPGCGIRQTDVPTSHEVLDLSQSLLKILQGRNLPYGIACEHEHSCSVLLAHNRFLRDGVWHTWIDYPKFNEWVKQFEGKQPDPSTTADALDYSIPTPEWAQSGSEGRGFDPNQTRIMSKARKEMLDEGDRLMRQKATDNHNDNDTPQDPPQDPPLPAGCGCVTNTGCGCTTNTACGSTVEGSAVGTECGTNGGGCGTGSGTCHCN